MLDTHILEGKKAVFHTLGCKLNFAETATIRERLLALGVVEAEKQEQADICIVNTCSVTDTADRKCRQFIHRAVRENPGAFVLVTGCYAQLQPEQVAAIPGVSLVLGAEEKSRLLEELIRGLSQDVPSMADSGHYSTVRTADIRSFVPSCSRGNRTRYFLKVQDGCDYYCTYCTIPFARGRSRNGSIDSLVEQARQVVRAGGKEIVLTGVNIGDFGKTTGERFIDLIRALDEVEGISRYRISSIEPNLLTEEVIDFVAGSRAFMPHFHIPLQSGSDEVLHLMHRRYDTAFFAEKVSQVKSAMPHAFIGVDVMVGCRGETKACFQEAYEFLRYLDVDHLHVFTYSERPGTKALDIPHVVPVEERHRRSEILLFLSKWKTREFYERHILESAEVLLEHSGKGPWMYGFTRNYIRVEVPNHPLLDNHLVHVTLKGYSEDKSALTGEIIGGQI
mgnify:CR=1 FL=1